MVNTMANTGLIIDGDSDYRFIILLAGRG